MHKHVKIPPKKYNPAVQNANIERVLTEKLVKAKNDGILFGVLAMRIMVMMVMHDKHPKTDSDMNRELSSLADSILGNYVSLSDMVKAMHDEMGFTMTSEDINRIDPGLGAYLTGD